MSRARLRGAFAEVEEVEEREEGRGGRWRIFRRECARSGACVREAVARGI